MKKILFYINLIVSIWACEQEQINGMADLPSEPEDGRISVVFTTQLPMQIEYATGMEPMSRAEEADTVRAVIDNRYKAIFVKWTDNKWIIDTVVSAVFEKNKPNSSIVIQTGDVLPPVSIKLRPGEYKMGLFLNTGNLVFIDNLKPGTIVSANKDIPADEVLPAAYKLGRTPQGMHQALSREVFSGASSIFTVGKNDHLEDTGPTDSIRVKVSRKVTRFRYLLKEALAEAGLEEDNFRKTQYTLIAELEASAAQPFCDGLDILGKPRYRIDSTYTHLTFFSSEGSNRFLSEIDNRIYHMCLNIPPPMVSGTTGPTNPFSFILSDDTKPEGIPITLTHLHIAGQSSGSTYEISAEYLPYSMTLKPNSILQTIYEIKGKNDYTVEDDRKVYYLKITEDSNATRLFNPFYELNPYTFIK